MATTKKTTAKAKKQVAKAKAPVARRSKPFVRKLTDEQVSEIARRREDGEDRRDLAEEFGVSVVYVGQVGRTARVTKQSAAPVLAGGGFHKTARPKWMR